MDSKVAMPTAIRRSPEMMARSSSSCQRNRSIRLQMLRHCSASVASRPSVKALNVPKVIRSSAKSGRARVIDRLDVHLQALEPASDQGRGRRPGHA